MSSPSSTSVHILLDDGSGLKLDLSNNEIKEVWKRSAAEGEKKGCFEEHVCWISKGDDLFRSASTGNLQISTLSGLDLVPFLKGGFQGSYFDAQRIVKTHREKMTVYQNEKDDRFSKTEVALAALGFSADLPAVGVGYRSDRIWIANKDAIFYANGAAFGATKDFSKVPMRSAVSLSPDQIRTMLYLPSSPEDAVKGASILAVSADGTLWTHGERTAKFVDVTAEATKAPNATTMPAVTWAKILPIVEKACAKCHGSGAVLWKNALVEANWKSDYAKILSRIEKVESSSMPPPASEQAAAFSAEERKLVVEWLKELAGVGVPAAAAPASPMASMTPVASPMATAAPMQPAVPDTPPITQTYAFWRGIDFGASNDSTVEGKSWVSWLKAQTLGLDASNLLPTNSNSTGLDAVMDAGLKSMLADAAYGNAATIAFTQDAPNGDYRVYYYFNENFQSSARNFKISLQGQAKIAGVGVNAQIGAWQKLGPWDAKVTDGKLTFTLEATGEFRAVINGLEIHKRNE